MRRSTSRSTVTFLCRGLPPSIASQQTKQHTSQPQTVTLAPHQISPPPPSLKPPAKPQPIPPKHEPPQPLLLDSQLPQLTQLIPAPHLFSPAKQSPLPRPSSHHHSTKPQAELQQLGFRTAPHHHTTAPTAASQPHTRPQQPQLMAPQLPQQTPLSHPPLLLSRPPQIQNADILAHAETVAIAKAMLTSQAASPSLSPHTHPPHSPPRISVGMTPQITPSPPAHTQERAPWWACHAEA
jgi:hypothetical protein